MPVLPFPPEPIRITLADLPAPYSTSSASKPVIVVLIPSNATLFVPDLKFHVSIYRDAMEKPRKMIYNPTGDTLVTEMHGNRISILIGDQTAVFADQSNGISEAFGMAVVEVSHMDSQITNSDSNSGLVLCCQFRRTSSISVHDGRSKALGNRRSSVHLRQHLPLDTQFDSLFLTVGSGSNVDIEYPSRASVQVLDLDGSHNQTFAWGLRNPVGIDFHPKTGDLYVSVQERDEIGDDLVPDYFTRIQQGEFFEWPFGKSLLALHISLTDCGV
jgi:glucose/arabinose dehydrogenase